MTYYASPAADVQQTAATAAPSPFAGNQATPPQNQGIIPYTIDSLRLGFQNLGQALSQDFQNLDAFAHQNFPGSAPPPANPTEAAQRQAELGPVFGSVGGILDSYDPSSPQYNPTAASKLFTWLLIGAGVLLAIELAPTINTLSSNARRR